MRCLALAMMVVVKSFVCVREVDVRFVFDGIQPLEYASTQLSIQTLKVEYRPLFKGMLARPQFCLHSSLSPVPHDKPMTWPQTAPSLPPSDATPRSCFEMPVCPQRPRAMTSRWHRRWQGYRSRWGDHFWGRAPQAFGWLEA